MAKVKLYGSGWCGYCAAARKLFAAKGVEWEEIDVDTDPDAAREMRAATDTTTVPQIFIGETHVGGFDALTALEEAGKLDALLAGE